MYSSLHYIRVRQMYSYFYGYAILIRNWRLNVSIIFISFCVISHASKSCRSHWSSSDNKRLLFSSILYCIHADLKNALVCSDPFMDLWFTQCLSSLVGGFFQILFDNNSYYRKLHDLWHFLLSFLVYICLPFFLVFFFFFSVFFSAAFILRSTETVKPTSFVFILKNRVFFY